MEKVMFFAMLCVLLVAHPTYMKLSKLTTYKQEVSSMLSDLKAQNKSLYARIEDSATQKEAFFEGVARERFGLGREGELVLRVEGAE